MRKVIYIAMIVLGLSLQVYCCIESSRMHHERSLAVAPPGTYRYFDLSCPAELRRVVIDCLMNSSPVIWITGVALLVGWIDRVNINLALMALGWTVIAFSACDGPDWLVNEMTFAHLIGVIGGWIIFVGWFIPRWKIIGWVTLIYWGFESFLYFGLGRG